ncbi:MAG: hypothetical protein IPM69_15940 [Ignavibacteria bacterium]|nr:hypothetical protein [Ignavibacteria bacterium]
MTNEQFESHIQQANIHEQKGNFDEAELLASEVLAELDNPSIAFQDNDTVEHLRARALLILAMTELQRGMYDKAIELAQGVLVSAEENIHIHDQLQEPMISSEWYIIIVALTIRHWTTIAKR